MSHFQAVKHTRFFRNPISYMAVPTHTAVPTTVLVAHQRICEFGHKYDLSR